MKIKSVSCETFCSSTRTEKEADSNSEVEVKEHPSVTDPAEPNQVDYSPLPSENLASPVPSEYFDFTQLF